MRGQMIKIGSSRTGGIVHEETCDQKITGAGRAG